MLSVPSTLAEPAPVWVVLTTIRQQQEGQFVAADAPCLPPENVRDSGRLPTKEGSTMSTRLLSAYVAAGVEHFVLDFSVPTVAEMLDVLERFAADVRPKVGR